MAPDGLGSSLNERIYNVFDTILRAQILMENWPLPSITPFLVFNFFGGRAFTVAPSLHNISMFQ